MPDSKSTLAGVRILAAFAHPDDEGFGCGGTLAMLVAGGAQITMLCATNGDVGEISDPSLATPETLGQVRQDELRQAMAVMDIPDLRFLGYRDSGMAGTEDNDHPDSLYQAEPAGVVSRIVDIMREVRPELVVTHDLVGAYGHPDHIAIYRHVTQAFSLAADRSYPGTSMDSTPPWQPRLLYHVCFPRSNFRRMWQQMHDAGITPPFASMEVESIGSPDEAVTTVVDVSAYVEVKIASLGCHRTQMDPNGPLAQLPEEMVRQIMSTEYFTLAIPGGAGREEDLLAGLV